MKRLRLNCSALVALAGALGVAAALPVPAAARPAAACKPAPLGATVLYIRGTLNNWGAVDDQAFQWSCDAYYLNVRLTGRHEFKIADGSWTNPTSFEAGSAAREAGPGGALRLRDGLDPRRAGNLAMTFSGEHTLKLSFGRNRRQPVLSLGPKTFTDPNAREVTAAAALAVRHDSRNPAHKAPFGATPAGQSVDFAISAPDGVDAVTLVIERRQMDGNQEVLDYRDPVRLPMARDAGAGVWRASHRFDAKGVYGYHFTLNAGGEPLVYHNNRNSIYWTRERGSNGLGLISHRPSQPTAIRRFRHTVHDPAFIVPDWAQDAVYYYIFPERFRNGDPANDPKAGRDTYQDKAVEVHPRWAGRPWKPGTGDGSDATFNNDFFGGDLEGIIQKLDYIKSLGANTIYMTPVFQAASNHKYDTADFRRIDPAFGKDEDFARLTSEAARRGIRVIPDTSLNHVGADSVYFDRWAKHPGLGAFENSRIQPASPFASWFTLDPSQPDPNRQFKGWTGTTDLPELDKASPAFRKFAYGDPDSVMKLWLDRGAAGWRMDVAPWVPDDFWREWRAAIKAHRPDALTVAETWFDSSKYFLGDTFDSTMNYILRNTLIDYANGGDARALYENVELMREVYPPQAFFALMNLLSSHDQARSLHLFGWTATTTDAATIARAKQRLRLAMHFLLTFPGSPAIFYGDEVGVTGGDDPMNRAPYPWADQGGAPDLALLEDFRALIALRNAHPVLRRGTIAAPLHLDAHVIVLAREHQGTWSLSATNNAATPQTVRVALPEGARGLAFKDGLNGEAATAGPDGTLSLTLPALAGRVFLSAP